MFDNAPLHYNTGRSSSPGQTIESELIAMAFTPEDLEEMRRADEEIEKSFRWTPDELSEAREREREIIIAQKTRREQELAAKQRAYYKRREEGFA